MNCLQTKVLLADVPSQNHQNQPGDSCPMALGHSFGWGKQIWRGIVNTAGALCVLSCMVAQATTMTDLFANRPTTSGVTVVFDGDSTAAKSEIGEPSHDGSRRQTLWGAWTAPGSGKVVIDTLGSAFDTVLAVYVGSALNSLEPVMRNKDIDLPDFKQSRVEFPVKPGTTYVIAVDGQSSNNTGFGSVKVNVAFTASAQSPSEVGTDAFAARPSLGSGPAALGVADTRFANLENFEPSDSSEGDNSVWWRWIAPGNGTVVIDTFGSDFDTLLTVYVGSSLTELTEVALSRDTVPAGKQSQVTFQTRGGLEYQIRVLGQIRNTTGIGNVVLRLAWAGNAFPGAIPGGDTFEKRGRMEGSNAEGVAMNRFFGRDPFEPDHGSDRGKTAWWSWVAPASGLVRIRTKDSDFDTHLVVYSGTSLTNLKRVALNNDASPPAAKWSEVSFQAQHGEEYAIVVDGHYLNDSGFGNIRLQVDQTVLPAESLTLYPAVELELPGTPGVRYQLQASPDLLDWTNVGGILEGKGQPIRVLDTVRGVDKRHYRYRIIP